MKKKIFKAVYNAVAFVGSLVLVGLTVLSVMVYGCWASENAVCTYDMGSIGVVTISKPTDDI